MWKNVKGSECYGGIICDAPSGSVVLMYIIAGLERWVRLGLRRYLGRPEWNKGVEKSVRWGDGCELGGKDWLGGWLVCRYCYRGCGKSSVAWDGRW